MLCCRYDIGVVLTASTFSNVKSMHIRQLGQNGSASEAKGLQCITKTPLPFRSQYIHIKITDQNRGGSAIPTGPRSEDQAICKGSECKRITVLLNCRGTLLSSPMFSMGFVLWPLDTACFYFCLMLSTGFNLPPKHCAAAHSHLP